MDKYPTCKLRPIEKIDKCLIGEENIVTPQVTFDIRSGGEFANKAIWLNLHYDWKVCFDSSGTLILLKLVKGTL